MKKHCYYFIVYVFFSTFFTDLYADKPLRFSHSFHQKIKDTIDYSFVIKDLSGESMSFAKFKNKVVLVNLWATWCGPCRVEMPHLQKLFENYHHSNFEVVTISLDNIQQLEKVKTYLSKNNFTFPVYFPQEDFPKVFRVPVIPTSFLLNQKGEIVWQNSGIVKFDRATFRKKIDEILIKSAPE